MQRETSPHRRRLRLFAILAASTIAALAAAVLAHGTVKPIAASSLHVFVDTPSTSVVQQPSYPFDSLVERGELFGRLITSQPAVTHIAQLAGVPPNQVGAYARTTSAVPAAFREPTSEERAAEILVAYRPY